ncbi:MAG: transcription elongation factor GreA [Flexilinea sp.]|nr:transcription elongation factor GreA [Flexilinea sp.]
MADQATYLTAEGKQKLEEELAELKNVKRPEIAARLRHAIEQGDISENADYSSAKEDQGFMEGRIQELEKLLSNVKLIDEMDREKGVVNIGSVVTLLEEGEDDEEVYTIVGTQEADPMNNKISFLSPIGDAIHKHKQGETVTVETPGGTIRMKIVKVQ